MLRRNVNAANPVSEPLKLTEAKKHLEIANSDTTHDQHVLNLITASRQQFERDTQRLTTSRTVVEKLADWPTEDWKLYYRPVISLDSITYVDENGQSQTLSSSVYSFDQQQRRILLAYDEDWPDARVQWDAITVTYTAGQTQVDEIVKSAIKLKLDYLFELRGMVADKKAVEQAYERLVVLYARETYP